MCTYHGIGVEAGTVVEENEALSDTKKVHPEKVLYCARKNRIPASDTKTLMR